MGDTDAREETRQTPYDSWLSARRACVLGAGTMGGGIAAHLANLGFEVGLLDLSVQSAADGFARAKSARPPHFYLPDGSERVKTGSIENDLGWVRDADWVCEAIVEDLDAKRALFERVEPLLRPDAMVSTNTSGLQIALLAEGRSESFRRRFVGTHFFNPPRYLKLLELIPTQDTDPGAIEAMIRFLEERAARRVVVAKDTPGFIANRYGMWCMFHAVHVAERLQLTVEQVDAITGPFLGRPKSASFRLNDLVGLDIMRDIAQNLRERCPDDPRGDTLKLPRSLEFLLEKGWIGEKAGQGYYRREGKELLAFDLKTNAYRQRQEPTLDGLEELGKLPLAERLGKALELGSEVGEFLREYLVPALQYANELKAEISRSVLDFDRVMKWGFGWEMGPFETADALSSWSSGISEGPFYKNDSQLAFDGSYVAITRPPEFAAFRDFPVVEQREACVVRDLGDGVAGIGIATKMGVITPALVVEMLELIESGRFGRLVLTSEARNFSVGFDLRFFTERIQEQDWEGIEVALANLQKLASRLGEIPSCAAVFGYGLGAGLELALGCCHVAADAESKIGFPEAKVGLLPGGGGTARTRALAQTGGPREMAQAAFRLMHGVASENADQARRMGFLRPDDATVYLSDRLIFEAKRLALEAKPVATPEWRTGDMPLTGMIDRLQDEAKARGEISAHDELIGDKIKAVFAKSASFEDALTRERQGFVELCKTGLTHTRIKHMLETGKPMRN